MAHDLVYYVFSHRDNLNLSSLLDASDTIAPDDQSVLRILHAHIRATTIMGFCLRANFSLFTELEHYFSLYWNIFVNQQDQVVGHPTGNLNMVFLTRKFGIDPPALQALWDSLDMYA